jgi:hypothetical protein
MQVRVKSVRGLPIAGSFANHLWQALVGPHNRIREFVVGTGGKCHYPIVAPIANSEVHNDESYGVLKLTLNPHSYEWQFVPAKGQTFSDSGGTRCH